MIEYLLGTAMTGQETKKVLKFQSSKHLIMNAFHTTKPSKKMSKNRINLGAVTVYANDAATFSSILHNYLSKIMA